MGTPLDWKPRIVLHLVQLDSFVQVDRWILLFAQKIAIQQELLGIVSNALVREQHQ
jgi:hypothetical protein